MAILESLVLEALTVEDAAGTLVASQGDGPHKKCERYDIKTANGILSNGQEISK